MPFCRSIVLDTSGNVFYSETHLCRRLSQRGRLRCGHGHVLISSGHVQGGHALVNGPALGHDILSDVLNSGASGGVADTGALERRSLHALGVHVVLYHLRSV